ncbi:MAG TPA: 6-hydroxymethylpterin diphosphokinase MptE-like protein [Tepidisphaeraceae bacterium]|nr:6-hydroxymethylpterin diphosphokinase MptE-like protein [Tepidisphaeraceae bacterium]
MIASADESCRYVLPPESPLLKNLAALWVNDHALAAELEALPEPAEYPTEIAQSGEATLSRPSATGKTIYLHSRFQPRDEARRLVASLKAQGKSAFYILGLGLGYHLEALMDCSGEESIFAVFEPDLRTIWTALMRLDVSPLIRKGRLMFFWRPDKSVLLTKMSPHSATIVMSAQTIPHAASIQLEPQFFSEVQAWLDGLVSYVRTGMNTLVANSARTCQNIAGNIAWYAASPSASRLKDRFKSCPAVIISAGPSLRKNKHQLLGLSDRAVLIAVQTTFQPLLEMGVEPHFVTSLDYHEICSRFFEKLPPTVKTELIAEPKATQAIFRLNPGPVTVLGNDFAEGLLREMALNKVALPAGATVAHLSYYVAELMGCDPIIFVGQDLAFSDGLCYAPGTSYEDVWRPELSRHCTLEMKQWEQIVRERPILRRVPDIEGRPIYTEERLFMYLQQFERDFATSRATIIDATEGGALKRGATPMPLADAIERYCRKPLSVSCPDHPGINFSNLDQCLLSLRKRREEADEIDRISRETLPLLEEIRDHLSDQPRVTRIIGRIDQLRAEMDNVGRTYDMVTQLTQETQLQRFERDRRLSASRAVGEERQRRQVERDIDNVRAVIDAAVEFAILMDQTIERLSAMIASRAVAA